VSDQLPELLDARRIMRELGVTRAAAEKLMRMLPVTAFEHRGLKKVYVRRSDLARLIDECTFAKDQVQGS
jgi:hypothetical protein